MGKLTDWCGQQPAWAIDALQRAAVAVTTLPEDVTALIDRIAAAHGLGDAGEHPCSVFAEASLRSPVDTPDDLILRSIGPVTGLDRLACDQTLEFAHEGVTIIFGDNGSGKSGYTRALRKLCNARLDAVLQGNVFAEGAEAPKAISYSYHLGTGAPSTEMWNDGHDKPAVLRGVTLLDTDNLRVYVDGKNEILYLPPEVACIGRLADMYQAAAGHFRDLITTATARLSRPFGGHYAPGTTAHALINRLQVTTARRDLPSEAAIEAAAAWSTDVDTELNGLNAQLIQGPLAMAARCDRIAVACNAAAADLERVAAPLDHLIVGLDWPMIVARQEKTLAAETLAAEQLGGQPIAATGSVVWKSLYQLARQFAAEANVCHPSVAFDIGDPCPLCQQPLGQDAVHRLTAFDAYVAGKATQEAADAAAAVSTRLTTLRALTFRPDTELTTLLAEAAAESESSASLVHNTLAYHRMLALRRDAVVLQLTSEQRSDFAPLAPSPAVRLREWATALTAHATVLRSSDHDTARISARVAELTAQRQVHGQRTELLARRLELDTLHAWKACEAALNTAPLSRLMSTLRKELTSPALEARIQAEIQALALHHIPLKFADKSDRGASMFEVELRTDRKARKARVLSEGEQRALSLACFLAESHVAGKRSAIILDDPVTSLDHGRVRRVARRLVDEAATGRQVIMFTHNLVFYHEIMLACVDRDTAVGALPCLIQRGPTGQFGMVTVGDEPWVARKVKDRETSLRKMLDGIPNTLPTSDQAYRSLCTSFYAALRETWERAIEEIVLNDVVRRFGSDVGTLRLGGVEVSDDDFMIVYRAMKRASEHSGHDQAAGRQIETPDKAQMQADLMELIGFRTAKTKANRNAEDRRKTIAARPPKPAFG
ncbi:energy-coupling factor transporter ATP-binding protein EcfA2 [Novosphingobium sp. 1529]|uniref:AAA family ATPase n=1 Tax=Novosphingobium sp. 1529 TaxID=3156424 RepID=UPI00339AA523